MSGDGQNESGRKVVLVEVRFSSLLFTSSLKSFL